MWLRHKLEGVMFELPTPSRSDTLVECQETTLYHGTRAMERISWERFKKEFDDRYFPTIMRQQKSKEFANLVHGSMMVEYYVVKFMELGRFSPHLISMKSIRTEHFLDRLQMRIKVSIACLEIKDF